ncbi:MAG: hypothetical protein ABGX78_08075 [Microbacterium sp.]|uniref:hypothetical protein n=1 Tax=Microbacterium sp. TaxID=51671 RepID=UPI003242B09E
MSDKDAASTSDRIDARVIQRPRVLLRSFLGAGGVAALVLSGYLFLRLVPDPDLADVGGKLAWLAAPLSISAGWPPAVVAVSAWMTLLAGIACVVAYGVISWWVRTRFVKAPDRRMTVSEDLLELSLLAPMSIEQAIVFAECLRFPWVHFERITEAAEYGTRTIRVSSSFSLSSRQLGEEVHALPLLLVSRGRLEHGLRITSESGARISSLANAQASAYAIRAVRTLIRAAGRRAFKAYMDSSPGCPSLDDRTVAVLTAVDLPPRYAEPNQIADAIGELPLPKARRHLAHAAAVIVLYLAEQYPVCVPVKAMPDRGQPTRVTVERVVIPEVTNYSFEPTRLLGKLEATRKRYVQWVRNVVGVPPDTLDYPTALAARTASYHLTVRGPNDTYLAHQELRDLADEGRSLSRSTLADLSYAMNRRLGQRTGHLYVRNGRAFGDLLYSCKFYERMPGSMSTAFVGAVSTTLVAAAIAFYSLYSTGELSGFLQILLAFPLALTATSSFRQGAPFWGGDLGARTATVVTVAVLAASLWASILADIVSHGSQAVLWASILVVSACNTLVCLISWVSRASTQHRFLNRRTEGPKDDVSH